MRNIVLNIVVAAKKIFRTPTCTWRDFQIRTRQRKKRKTKMLSTKYLKELSNGLAVAIKNYFDTYKE